MQEIYSFSGTSETAPIVQRLYWLAGTRFFPLQRRGSCQQSSLQHQKVAHLPKPSRKKRFIGNTIALEQKKLLFNKSYIEKYHFIVSNIYLLHIGKKHIKMRAQITMQVYLRDFTSGQHEIFTIFRPTCIRGQHPTCGH